MQGNGLDLIVGRPQAATDEGDRCLSQLWSSFHEATERGPGQHHRGNLGERRGIRGSRQSIERGNLAKDITVS